MTISTSILRTTAIAAILGAPVAATAQESGQTDQTTDDQTTNEQSTGNQATGDSSASGSSGDMGAGDEQNDAVIATVGDAEIRGSDVMTVIGMFPPELQSQPPQMLVPMALEQLILRELILEQARAENLASDPEVVALVENNAQGAEDDAMVQVWVQRQMENAVTDEAVQQTYDEAKAEGQDLPDIAQVRPQIEDFLRQQAMQNIRTELQEGADVVFYDATGRPVEQAQGQGSGSTGSSAGNGASASGDDGSSGDADNSGDDSDNSSDSN